MRKRYCCFDGAKIQHFFEFNKLLLEIFYFSNIFASIYSICKVF